MRFTFSTGSLPLYSLPSVFAIARASSADGIELLLTPALINDDPAEILRLAATYNVPVTSVHCVLRLGATSPETEFSDILNSAKFTSHLQSAALVVHLPDVQQRQIPNRWRDALQHAQETLMKTGAAVSLENPQPREPFSTEQSDQLRLRWEAISAEFETGLTFDTCHAHAAGWDILEWASNPNSRFDNVHVSDRGGRSWPLGILNGLLRDHRPPGYGDLQIERFLARLAQTEFSGLITLEISPLRIPWYWRPAAEQAISEMLLYCRRATGDVRTRIHRPRGHHLMPPGSPIDR